MIRISHARGGIHRKEIKTLKRQLDPEAYITFFKKDRLIVERRMDNGRRESLGF